MHPESTFKTCSRAQKLAEKAIKDRLTRILVIFGATAGMCYTALWYFPTLIVAGGIVTVAWDLWLHRRVSWFRANRAARKRQAQRAATSSDPAAEEAGSESVELPSRNTSKPSPVTHSNDSTSAVQRRHPAQAASSVQAASQPHASVAEGDADRTDVKSYAIPVPIGLTIIALFFGECSDHSPRVPADSS